MTPIARGPKIRAAERNSGSIAGRKRFSRMPVGRRYVDAPVFYRHAIARMHGAERTGAGQNFRQYAVVRRGNMEHDEDRRRQARGQILNDGLQRADATRGSPHNDDVTRHASSLCHGNPSLR